MLKNKISAEMERIKERILQTPPGTEKSKFIKLYRWCQKLNILVLF